MSQQLVTVEYVCPYCGHENTYRMELNPYISRELVYCDSETGGCDKLLIVETKLDVKVKTLRVQQD